MTKQCKLCEEIKSMDQFYGSQSTCIDCVKARAQKYRADNLERVRQYDRERGTLPHRKARVKANAEKYEQRASQWRANNHEKYKAHYAVSNAVRDGLLVKPEKCERCEQTVPVFGHHEDYSQLLDVIWLCSNCHGMRHREINEVRRNYGPACEKEPL